MEKLPGWAKWLILLAGVAGIAAAALWLDDYVTRVEQLPPDAGLFAASTAAGEPEPADAPTAASAAG